MNHNPPYTITPFDIISTVKIETRGGLLKPATLEPAYSYSEHPYGPYSIVIVTIQVKVINQTHPIEVWFLTLSGTVQHISLIVITC